MFNLIKTNSIDLDIFLIILNCIILTTESNVLLKKLKHKKLKHKKLCLGDTFSKMYQIGSKDDLHIKV